MWHSSECLNPSFPVAMTALSSPRQHLLLFLALFPIRLLVHGPALLQLPLHRLVCDAQRGIKLQRRILAGISLLCSRLAHLDRPVAYVLALHLTQRFRHIPRIFERDEPVAFGLMRVLILDDPRHLKARITREGRGQHVIVRLVAQIADEDAEIVFWPRQQRLVLPGLTSNRPRDVAVLRGVGVHGRWVEQLTILARSGAQAFAGVLRAASAATATVTAATAASSVCRRGALALTQRRRGWRRRQMLRTLEVVAEALGAALEDVARSRAHES